MRADDIDGVRLDLAAALRQARAESRLSGRALAVKAHMSQSKISRIEHNQLTPSPVDVEMIMRALNPPAVIADRITALAARVNQEYDHDRRYKHIGWKAKQREMETLDYVTTQMRFFLPAMLPGLLHTPQYSNASVTHCISTGGDLSSVVPSRIRRQEALREGKCMFTFVLTESALRWPYVETATHADQMRHIAEIALLPRATIRVIPLAGKVIRQGPMCTFAIYDQRLVRLEVLNGEVLLRDPRDISFHLDVFAFFEEQSLSTADSRDFVLDLAAEFDRQSSATASLLISPS